MKTEANEALAARLEEALKAGVTDEAMKVFKKKLDDLLYAIDDHISYELKDKLAPELTDFIVNMAERAVNSLLEGNEQEMIRWLQCDNRFFNGRSNGYTWGAPRDISEWHRVIHGRLFETGSVELRKKIVEAHKTLLQNERILDLEDQVKSLVAQVNKANDEKDKMWERLRALQ